MAFKFNPITGKLDLVGSGGGSSQTLAQTLAIGDTTDGNNILISDGDKIQSEDETSTLKMLGGGVGFEFTTDNGGFLTPYFALENGALSGQNTTIWVLNFDASEALIIHDTQFHVIAPGNIFDNDVSIGTGVTPTAKLDVKGGTATFGDGTNYAEFSATGDLHLYGSADYLVPIDSFAFKLFEYQGYGLKFDGTYGYVFTGANDASKIIFEVGPEVGDTHIGYASISTNNMLNVYGNSAFGVDYVDIAAPTNGLIIQGNVGIATTDPQSHLQLGDPGVSSGTLTLAGSSSDFMQIRAPAAPNNWTLTLPPTQGSSGQFLKLIDSSGSTDWDTPTTGTPGGSTDDIQYNAGSGVFGGITGQTTSVSTGLTGINTTKGVITSTSSTSVIADGTYTVGIGLTQNGTITTSGGLISAIQQII